MDVIFQCPHCEQELSVDAAGAGTSIDCPSCSQRIVIPQPPPQETPAANPIKTSAGAKEEKHFAVPQHDKPAEVLIEKPLPPLEVSAKEGIHIRVKSIKRSDCVEVGKDHFDEVVTSFLGKVGEANVVSISTFNYTHMDLATRDWVTDYGAFIVYKG